MTLEQRPIGREERNYTADWRKSVPGRENSKCQGPEAGLCLECLKNIQEPRVAGVQGVRDRVVRERQAGKGQFT